MTNDIEGATIGRTRMGAGTPDQVDRALLIASVVLWLAALGTGVAALVALIDLAHGRAVDDSGGGSDTPWLLYTVIGVSAAVILCAVPLLIRARRTASNPTRPAADASRSAGASSVAQPLPPFGAPVLRRHASSPLTSRVGFPIAAVDQIWLRCTASVASAMGAAATGIGVATYLMASGHDTASWSVYVVAALFTAAIPVAVVYFLRQLRSVLDASA